MALTNIGSKKVINKIINGRFDFWQRGTSFNTPNGYTADRWTMLYDGTIGTFTVSRQTFDLGQTAVPGNPEFYYRWNHTAAGSGSSYRVIEHRIEGVETHAGKRVTLSFYMKADSTRSVSIAYNQVFGSGGSPSATVAADVSTISVGTNWQKYSVTFDLPSITGKTLGSNNNDYVSMQWKLPLNVTMMFDLANVMLEEGSIAHDFVFSAENLGSEFNLCQRYFHKLGGLDVDQPIHPAATSNGTNVYGSYIYPVLMRRAPTISVSNVANFKLNWTGGAPATNAFTLYLSTTAQGYSFFWGSASAPSANAAVFVTSANSTDYIYHDAEL